MALSTGRNEICSLVVRHHFQPGMGELVSFAQCLIEARSDLSRCHKMKRHIVRASQEMDKALEELKGGLRTIDARSVQLVAQKNRLEGERQAQAQQLSHLKYQLDSHRSQESESTEMLGTAQRHLEEMQQRLSQKEEEIRSSQQMRDIGIGLMFIPIVGTIPGTLLAVCGQIGLDEARSAKRNAEVEVDRCSDEVDRCSAEINRIQALITEAERKIWTTERKLYSYESEKLQLSSQQAEIVTFQNTLRKCVTFLAVLAGKVDTAELLTRDVVVYSELERILEGILNHVYPLMGQGRETRVMALSTSEIRGLIGRLKSARERLSLEGPRSGRGSIAIDF